jgi:copper chaperone CopZ
MNARFGLSVLILAAAALGAVAVRARERTYVVPEHLQPATIPFELDGDPPPGCDRRTLHVEGVCCQGCSAKLHGALMAVDGVSAVAVDPLNARVTAFANSELTDEVLERALTFDKYVATSAR